MEPQRTLTNRERAIAHAREQLDAARAMAAEQPREPATESPGNSLAIAPQSSSSADLSIAEQVGDELSSEFVALHDRLDAIVRRLDASELDRSKPIDWAALPSKIDDLWGSITPQQWQELSDKVGALFDKVRPAKRASSPALDAVGALTDDELRPIANECDVTIGQVRSIGQWLASILGASSAP